MAFIRTKRQGDREYAYVVETYWDSSRGTPRQRVLAYLGPVAGVRAALVPLEHRDAPAVERWLRRHGADREPPSPADLARARARLKAALLAADAPGTWDAATAAVDRFGLFEFLDQVATPTLYEVGDDWRAGRLTVADEHVVARSAHEMLVRLRDEWRGKAAVPRGMRARLLLANPEGEQHALALDVLECRLAAQGHETLVLSGGLPPGDLVARALAFLPDAVLLSATLPASAVASLRAAEAVVEQLPGVRAILGGQAWASRPAARVPDRVVLAGDRPVEALLRG